MLLLNIKVMRKIHLLLLMLVAASTFAQDHLYIDNLYIRAGETKDVEIILRNETTYSALQTDLVVPDGLQMIDDDGEFIIRPTSRLTSNHQVSSYQLPDGAIRILVTSQNVWPISGHDGAVLSMTLKADDSFAGSKAFTLSNTIVVEEDGTKHVLDEFVAWINVGDVTGDGKVDVEDVNAVINLILKLNTVADYPGTPDVTGDGKIDVEDVNAIINIILKV